MSEIQNGKVLLPVAEYDLLLLLIQCTLYMLRVISAQADIFFPAIPEYYPINRHRSILGSTLGQHVHQTLSYGKTCGPWVSVSFWASPSD